MTLRKKSVEAMEQTLETFRRIRNREAPLNAKRKKEERGQELLPCAEVCKCMNCRAGKRICNITTIIENKTRAIDVPPLIVGRRAGAVTKHYWGQHEPYGL